MKLKKYIYLDWNVIQYMKKETIVESKNIDGRKFKELVEKISNKYAFPWSEGHLEDLLVSLKNDNFDYIKEDLSFLKIFSNNYVVGIEEKKGLMVLKDLTKIEKQFNIIKERNKFFKNQELVLEFERADTFNIDISSLNPKHPYASFIKENNGVLDETVYRNFIMSMHQNRDNPDYYKKIRVFVESLKKEFKTIPNSVISQESDYFQELIPFLDFLITNNLEILKKDFEKTMIAFLNIDKKRIFNNLTVADKIQLAYSLLDYNQLFRDKINKKNKPSNMHRDITHLHFASNARYYVTEDTMTYKKSKFVCEVLGLTVKVLKMDEFINKFN